MRPTRSTVLPQIGDLIKRAMDRVGRAGVVTMEESRTAEDHLYVVEGMQFERGYISPYFVTDPERMVTALSSFLTNSICARSRYHKTPDSLGFTPCCFDAPFVYASEVIRTSSSYPM